MEFICIKKKLLKKQNSLKLHFVYLYGTVFYYMYLVRVQYARTISLLYLGIDLKNIFSCFLKYVKSVIPSIAEFMTQENYLAITKQPPSNCRAIARRYHFFLMIKNNLLTHFQGGGIAQKSLSNCLQIARQCDARISGESIAQQSLGNYLAIAR